MARQVDYSEVKAKISVAMVLEECGVDMSQYRIRDRTLSGPCPLPKHPKSDYRNKEQFKCDTKKYGYWMWQCFGDCKSTDVCGGDVITLCMEMTGLDNKHVPRWIDEKFGNILTGRPAKPVGPDADTASGQAEPQSEMLRLQEQLREMQASLQALTEKGCVDAQSADEPVTETKPEVVAKVPKPAEKPTQPFKPWRFKYTDLDPEAEYLAKRGVSPGLAQRFGIGLCHPKPNKKRWLDDYIGVPLHGPKQLLRDNPLGYYGRLATFDDNDPRPRHKLPEGFPKQSVLFGWQQAMAADDERIIVVEGVFDLLAVVTAGFRNVVCTLGSVLSPQHAELLIGTGRRVWLAYDNNEAGNTGMRKGAALLIRHVEVRVVRLPEEKQPDDLSDDELKQLLG